MNRNIAKMFGIAALFALTWTVPVRAATQITMAGTQFVPAVSSITFGDTITWTNSEPADYPVVIGKHNIIPDPDTAALLGLKAFPTSSKLLGLGQSWSCTGSTSGAKCVGANGKTVTLTRGNYTFKCGLHPNQMRGILVIA